ncbi:hypothetical protein HII36_01540 [Nonomuraea sp. NN258]|uniref:anti-sigma factor family protein n=1 Tax=Nonomuraea antri TaxID=2730852 RepID=UPI001569CA14|nr:zf-HC2 domain-containing protein [Nonomuraea antri]NRQ30529.1 hypothetical protein [Nonomuraea antri]
MTSRVEHTDVGAYALGLLEDDDRRAFESHLLACGSCRAELSDLAGVASVLSGIAPVEDDPPLPGGQDNVIDLLRRKKAADQRARRGTFVIGVAAAVTLVAGGLTIGTQLTGESAAPAQAHESHLGPAEQFYAAGEQVEGTGADGVSGGMVYESKGWGTHAAVKLAGVKGPLECELVSVAKSGERRIMTGWRVPPTGYGVPGSPAPLYMHGGSPTALTDIDRFEVVTRTGRTLLTVDI